MVIIRSILRRRWSRRCSYVPTVFVIEIIVLVLPIVRRKPVFTLLYCGWCGLGEHLALQTAILVAHGKEASIALSRRRGAGGDRKRRPRRSG